MNCVHGCPTGVFCQHCYCGDLRVGAAKLLAEHIAIDCEANLVLAEVNALAPGYSGPATIIGALMP